MNLDSFISYLQHERRYSAHTIKGYSADLLQFQDFLGSQFETDDFTVVNGAMARSWVVTLLEQGKDPKTVNRKISTLKTFYKYLVRTQVVDKNPMLQVVSPKIGKKLPEFVPQRDMEFMLDPEAFEDDFDGWRDRMIIELLYYTGMRRAELLGLKLSDVDLNGGTLRVLGKRNKERILPIIPGLVTSIRDYLEVRNTVASNDDHLLLTSKGKKLYPNLVYRTVIAYLGKASSITKKSPHVLRHSFATHMLNNGADLNAIKELLGHANLSATQVYTHNSVEQLKNIYKQAHPRA